MDAPTPPLKVTATAMNFSNLLTLAGEFRTKCPGILLGQNGAFFIDMEIVGKLTLLSKLQINPNDVAQYQLSVDIIEHIGKLNTHLKKAGEDHPVEHHQLLEATYYTHLELIKQNIFSYQEKNFPQLHSARHLILLLNQLKRFDSKEQGALHQLLLSLEKTFHQSNIPANEKLRSMMQQVADTRDAIKKTSQSPIKLFGIRQKLNPLAPAIETFINEEMAHIAKLNDITPLGIADEHTPSQTPRNTSTNP